MISIDLLRKIRRQWKPRKKTAHKGDFGRLLIVAGSRGLTGAAHLTSSAASCSGAGLVTLAVPEKIYPILARREKEVMVRPFAATRDGSFSSSALRPLLDFAEGQDVIAVGPGLSQNRQTQTLIRGLVTGTRGSLVIDADGLNAFKGHLALFKKCRGRAILTPHPGEFMRLFGGKLSGSDRGRMKRAIEIAREHGVVLVLKGYHTIIADPDGEIYCNRTGNPGMAKGGTGDVLTGIISALVAQKFSLWDAARFGVYLHGFAGDMAAKETGQISLRASDIVSFLPRSLKKVLGW